MQITSLIDASSSPVRRSREPAKGHKMKIYYVTLYWQDGGSIYLGGIKAGSPSEAESAALDRYVAKSPAQREEIEMGGGYQLDASLA